jgi:hypothetical protein
MMGGLPINREEMHEIDGCQFPTIFIIKQWIKLFLADPC